MSRPSRRAAILLLLALVCLALPESAGAGGSCRVLKVTGYVRSEYGPLTYDETPIWTPEPIAAASWDIPLGMHVAIQNVGRFRIADRGRLGADGWVDVAVWSRAEAYQLTGSRWACVIAPDDPDPIELEG